MSPTARNQRIQVFDQDGNFIAAWKQFGEPSSVFVGKDDTIYVGAVVPRPGAPRSGEVRGIVIGNAKDGSLKAFIPDPADLDKVDERHLGVGHRGRRHGHHLCRRCRRPQSAEIRQGPVTMGRSRPMPLVPAFTQLNGGWA